MRKILFYIWGTGWLALYAYGARWTVHWIADSFGIGIMVTAGILWVGMCALIARRIDRADAIRAAAERSVDYRPAPRQARVAIAHSPQRVD